MARSILQNCEDGRYCFFCKKNGAVDPLDKHHVFGGALRKKSESFGLWVYLCHDACHENGPKSVQKNRRVDQALKAWAQRKAMKYYGWNVTEFMGHFWKNYLDNKAKEEKAV